jgi:hypothetical protein
MEDVIEFVILNFHVGIYVRIDVMFLITNSRIVIRCVKNNWIVGINVKIGVKLSLVLLANILLKKNYQYVNTKVEFNVLKT